MVKPETNIGRIYLFLGIFASGKTIFYGIFYNVYPYSFNSVQPDDTLTRPIVRVVYKFTTLTYRLYVANTIGIKECYDNKYKLS